MGASARSRGSREPGFATGSATPTADAAPGRLGTIPASFDLAVGYPRTNPDGSPVEVDRDISGSTFALCGPDVPTGADRVDEAVVKYTSPAAPRTRVLQLFAGESAGTIDLQARVAVSKR